MVCLIGKKQWILNHTFFFSSALSPSIKRTTDCSQSHLSWTEAESQHSPRESPHFYKGPLFPHIKPGSPPPLGEANCKCINQASCDWDRNSHFKTKLRLKLTKKYMAKHTVQLAIRFFVNFVIFKWRYLVYCRVYFHQIGDFVKLSLHFMTLWISSC